MLNVPQALLGTGCLLRHRHCRIELVTGRDAADELDLVLAMFSAAVPGTVCEQLVRQFAFPDCGKCDMLLALSLLETLPAQRLETNQDASARACTEAFLCLSQQ